MRVITTGALAGKSVTAIAAGSHHSLAWCADGTLCAWGYNNNYQLGRSTTPSSTSLVPLWINQTGGLAGKTLTAISAGAYHNLVCCADGTWAAWGFNGYGQLGNGTPSRASIRFG